LHPKVQERFHAIVRESRVRPRRALEVGGVTGSDSLLRWPELATAERYCLNLVRTRARAGIRGVVGNANHMDVFHDAMFDLVVCNATLEHDKFFWLSVAEMRRVLAPGGLLIIGTPGYTEMPQRDHGRATHTYRVHYRFDYYRFSEQVFHEVFLAGMEDVAVRPILFPPRIIGLGFKPGGEPSAMDREGAVRALTSAPASATLPRRQRPRSPEAHRWRGRIGRLLGRVGVVRRRRQQQP
jgi:SAM-dependent methyltransferase